MITLSSKRIPSHHDKERSVHFSSFCKQEWTKIKCDKFYLVELGKNNTDKTKSGQFNQKLSF
ncbi:hypothetical protein CO583_02075 [Parasaccharibacter sp. TMW2.1882]|nr:hypothetical protein [Parasaccharibacter sp. TMW2.1882]